MPLTTIPPIARPAKRAGDSRSSRVRIPRTVPITGPARVRPAIDGDVEFIRHRVVNTVLHDIGRTAPGELIVAIEWLIPRVNAMPGITWKTARDVAWRESMLRFGKPGTSHSAWMLAARLRAFAALMDRVSGRLLIDVGWIRAQLDRGMDKNGVLADLIQRHKRILDEETPLHTGRDGTSFVFCLNCPDGRPRACPGDRN